MADRQPHRCRGPAVRPGIIGYATQPAFDDAIRCWAGPTQSLGPSNRKTPPALAAASLPYLLAPITLQSGNEGNSK